MELINAGGSLGWGGKDQGTKGAEDKSEEPKDEMVKAWQDMGTQLGQKPGGGKRRV